MKMGNKGLNEWQAYLWENVQMNYNHQIQSCQNQWMAVLMVSGTLTALVSLFGFQNNTISIWFVSIFMLLTSITWILLIWNFGTIRDMTGQSIQYYLSIFNPENYKNEIEEIEIKRQKAMTSGSKIREKIAYVATALQFLMVAGYPIYKRIIDC
jgi:hypothetical protein